MAYDLNLVSNPAFVTGKYGQALSAGYAEGTDVFLGLTDYTFEAWVRTSASGSIIVAAGSAGNSWLGMNANGTATGHYGNGTDRAVTGPVINDGAWHHLAICASTTTGGSFWVDGVQAGTAGNADPTISKGFAIRYFGGAGTNAWAGEVDEVAITSGIKYTAPFTPGPVTNSQSNLRAVWHLDGNGTNSAGLVAPSATTLTLSLSSPSVAVGSAVTATIGTNNALTGSQTESVTLTAPVAGNWSPSNVVTLNAATATATATFTASASGSGSITAAASGTPTLTGASAALTVIASATVPAAPTIGTAVAGNGYIDVYFTHNSDGGSAVLDSTATLSTGQSATGTTSPIRVTAPNNTAATATVKDRNGVGSSAASAASNSVTPVAPPNAFDVTKIKFSPGNWDIQTGFARTICAGAYFETLFTGTSCTLSFDMTGVATPYPILAYRVDEHGPWQTVTLAASIPINVPSATAGQSTHFLRMEVISTSQATDGWNGACMVKLAGITLDSGKALSLPALLPNGSLALLSDSIGEGTNTLNNSGDNTNRSSSAQGWVYLMARALGMELGNISFGSQGVTVGGARNVPKLILAFDKQFAGVDRVFPTPPTAILIQHGTNDPPATDITPDATAFLNAALAKWTTPKLIVLRPLNGTHAPHWIAAIAACSTPSRVIYVDTAGWADSAGFPDGTHPAGYENIRHIAPAAALGIKAALAGAAQPPALASRTVSLTLTSGLDTNNQPVPAANLTGLKIAFYDEATPDLHSVPRYKTASGTTNASGVLSFPVQSTLVSGGTGCVVALMPDGRNLVMSVTVA